MGCIFVDNGQLIVIQIGPQTNPQIIRDLFDVPSHSHSHKQQLQLQHRQFTLKPRSDLPNSTGHIPPIDRLWNIIDELRAFNYRSQSIHVLTDSASRQFETQFLIRDRTESVMELSGFLQFISQTCTQPIPEDST